MRCLEFFRKIKFVVFEYCRVETFYQVRERNQTKWISASDWIYEQKQNHYFFNQGVFHEHRTKRTIIAIEKK